MAGHSKRKAALEDFARRAREAEVGETALDWIIDQIGSGETFRSICKTSKPELSENAIRTELYRAFGEDEVRRRLAAARQDGADSLADKTVEVAEGIADKDQAAAARVEVSSLQWLAGKWNREQYGDRPAPAAQVNLNFGSLLLQAHRAIESGQVAALPPADTAVDAEIITDGDQHQAEPQGPAPQEAGREAGAEDPGSQDQGGREQQEPGAPA